MNVLLDTSAWIEYFKGTKKGEEINSLLTQETDIHTCPLTISEITSWCCKNNKDPSFYLNKIKNLSKLTELSEDILFLSGKVYSEARKKNDKIGLIDCIIYTTALRHRLVFVTIDNDFRDLPSVKII